MTNLGPLTTLFVPSGSACQSIHVGITTAVTFIEHGTVSDCFPSNFKPQNTFYYSPGICQLGYTYGCSGDGGLPGVTVATCCPTGFTCRPNLPGDDPNACQSAFTTAGSLFVDVFSYSTGSPTNVGVTTAYYKPGDTVFAKGLAIQRAASDPEWNTATTGVTGIITAGPSSMSNTPFSTRTTTTAIRTQEISTPPINRNTTGNPNADSSNLSSGAKAGIGVGIGIGVLLNVAVIIIAYRCGKQRGISSIKTLRSHYPIYSAEIWETKPAVEMEEQRRIQELRAIRDPAELGG
ncbi:hypothetical protein O1611_g4212 [Lasiodiplodia mahajangana]|uniref:Uncharacterized protein n=1 Tax=Lasiodiplodia mahajangana TaxID=1108764 RepID=A0ACC2JPW0_9PEZI|nr:hypothetical protein O1611_g4212 [Lasiodiplodia mahajangana]